MSFKYALTDFCTHFTQFAPMSCPKTGVL